MTIRTKTIAGFIFLTTLTLIVEMIGLPQPFTGPLINMMLILTTLLLNPLAGAGLGAGTPLIAALRGQLPAPLIPMVPFIIVGNALYVLTFAAVRRALRRFEPYRGPLFSPVCWFGLIVGSTLKFGFLYLSARTILPLLVARHLPDKLVALMSLPQLMTALIGGGLAFFFHQLLSKRMQQ